VDLRVQKKESYGAMLQYFTGSKNHNIALRSYALTHGLSLSEYGIKHVTTAKLDEFSREEDFYNALALTYIPPELREDKGEIDAALKGKLPKLVDIHDMKGDLHIHTNYNLQPSHDLGADPLSDYLSQAATLGYEYIGLSDHNPSVINHTKEQIVHIMKLRKEYYEQQHYSWQKNNNKRVYIVIMCEVDILPDGKLALPTEAFDYVDGVIASIHSSFTQEKEMITKRIVSALSSNAKVRIFGHPTARLINKREEINADWKEIFSVCHDRNIALEISAFPNRLDLPDVLVYDAKKYGCKFCIDTDSHSSGQMISMPYGISVARRGWADKHDIVNTLTYNEFTKWFMKGAK
jgi:DNA polymerase (family 10)